MPMACLRQPGPCWSPSTTTRPSASSSVMTWTTLPVHRALPISEALMKRAMMATSEVLLKTRLVVVVGAGARAGAEATQLAGVLVVAVPVELEVVEWHLRHLRRRWWRQQSR